LCHLFVDELFVGIGTAIGRAGGGPWQANVECSAGLLGDRVDLNNWIELVLYRIGSQIYAKRGTDTVLLGTNGGMVVVGISNNWDGGDPELRKQILVETDWIATLSGAPINYTYTSDVVDMGASTALRVRVIGAVDSFELRGSDSDFAEGASDPEWESADYKDGYWQLPGAVYRYWQARVSVSRSGSAPYGSHIVDRIEFLSTAFADPRILSHTRIGNLDYTLWEHGGTVPDSKRIGVGQGHVIEEGGDYFIDRAGRLIVLGVES
jgi:hypothetical protein